MIQKITGNDAKEEQTVVESREDSEQGAARVCESRWLWQTRHSCSTIHQESLLTSQGRRQMLSYPLLYTLYNLSLQDSHKSRFPAWAQPGIDWLAILFSEILEPWPCVGWSMTIVAIDINCSNICTRIWQWSSQVSFQDCKQRNKGML